MAGFIGHFDQLVAPAMALVEVIGILTALDALMHTRTSQGAVAWCVGLVAFPLIALPLYWVLGRNRFAAYVAAIAAVRAENERLLGPARAAFATQRQVFDPANEPLEAALDQLSARRFTRGNRASLLVNGEATFEAIFEAIGQARNYVLIQTFIIHDDGLGRRLRDKLLERASAGVRVYLLYDAIGSHALPARYVEELRAGGCRVHHFGAGILSHRYQINFRNHRKIVLVDGRFAFVGGQNFGDEYLGKSPRLGPWRDTHVRVEGPAVQDVQAIFMQDWYWAAREHPELEWQPVAMEGGCNVLPLEMGPVGVLEPCTLFFHQVIGAARARLWITSPYFVPDEGLVSALQAAALRGVDVRIMLPSYPDHLLVWLASFSYLEQMDAAGVKLYRYQQGFLHQKVILVDDRIAVVGTANLDNRSARLNFEINVVVADRDFAREVCAMLERDFEACRCADIGEYCSRPLYFRVAARVARLFAPVL
jgi:cardiolipin synthase